MATEYLPYLMPSMVHNPRRIPAGGCKDHRLKAILTVVSVARLPSRSATAAEVVQWIQRLLTSPDLGFSNDEELLELESIPRRWRAVGAALHDATASEVKQLFSDCMVIYGMITLMMTL